MAVWAILYLSTNRKSMQFVFLVEISDYLIFLSHTEKHQLMNEVKIAYDILFFKMSFSLFDGEGGRERGESLLGGGSSTTIIETVFSRSRRKTVSLSPGLPGAVHS